jgi:hypothetical protein
MRRNRGLQEPTLCGLNFIAHVLVYCALRMAIEVNAVMR